MEKDKALDAALSQIERAFGKGSIMRLGQDTKIDIEAISTGSLGIDIALGIGGLPKGRIVEIYGPESSGKTTLALSVIAQAQKKGGTCAFIDAEHALDPSYAKKIGVDIMLKKLENADIVLAVFDGSRELSGEDREILMLRYFRRKTQCETAQILGMTQVMVSRRERKLLKELREQLV